VLDCLLGNIAAKLLLPAHFIFEVLEMVQQHFLLDNGSEEGDVTKSGETQPYPRDTASYHFMHN